MPYVTKHMASHPTSADLAKELGLSTQYLHKNIQAVAKGPVLLYLHCGSSALIFS